jgi:hypothetical protein
MKKSIKVGIVIYLSIGLLLGIFYGMNDVYCPDPIDPGFYMQIGDEPNPVLLEYENCLETLTLQKILRGVIVTVSWPLYFAYRYFELGVVYPWDTLPPGLTK